MNELNLLMKYIGGPKEEEASIAEYYRAYCRNVPEARSPFWGWLSRFALRNARTLRLADLWTRLFDPGNPLRYRLNAVVALSECRPFAALDRPGTGRIAAAFEILAVAADALVTGLAAALVIPTAYLLRRKA